METEGSVECFWSNLKTHPKCPHGPTLLFAMRIKNDLKYFYACSACRDRKMCEFYLKKDGDLTEVQQKRWEAEIKAFNQKYNHQKSYIRFHELLSERPDKRAYCYTCEKLISVNEIFKHQNHETVQNISDEQMHNPTTLLKPLTNAKKEAQYLFSKKATTEIVDLLINLGAKHILCIGAPRIHEYISQNHEDKLSSLLLDFDGRFHDFFGPLSFCWYNLFNHHFFNKESHSVFKDFLTQNNGKDIYLVCDPPFGGRTEAMSQTIKTISDMHKKWNELSNNDELRVLFFMPWFMKPMIQFKSNPAGVDGGLKDLMMADYKVDYDNHALFHSDPSGRKFGSPVRIFTNIPLNLMKLSEDGYKYCKRCDKWVGVENKHCKKCKACTSEDGRRYKHCNICNRCVKPVWKHCKKCNRCALDDHFCGSKPKISGHCIKCNNTDHIYKDCPEIVDVENGVSPKKSKKRKSNDDNSISNNKKQKLDVMKMSKKKKKGNKKGDEANEVVDERESNEVQLENKKKSSKARKKELKVDLDTIESSKKSKKSKKNKRDMVDEAVEEQKSNEVQLSSKETLIKADKKKLKINGISNSQTNESNEIDSGTVKKSKKKKMNKKIVKDEVDKVTEEKEGNRVQFKNDKKLKIKKKKLLKINGGGNKIKEESNQGSFNEAPSRLKLQDNTKSKLKKKIKMSIMELKGDSKRILPKKEFTM